MLICGIMYIQTYGVYMSDSFFNDSHVLNHYTLISTTQDTEYEFARLDRRLEYAFKVRLENVNGYPGEFTNVEAVARDGES